MLYQDFINNKYFNFRVNGIRSTSWSWKTIPERLYFEGWLICKNRSASFHGEVTNNKGNKLFIKQRQHLPFRLKRTRI